MSGKKRRVETCQDLSLSAERPAVSLRQVSWLRGSERLLSAPRYGLPICGVADSGRIVRGFPITVAGPRRILTGFPFIPQWAPSAKTSTQYRRTSSVSSGTGIESAEERHLHATRAVRFLSSLLLRQQLTQKSSIPGNDPVAQLDSPDKWHQPGDAGDAGVAKDTKDTHTCPPSCQRLPFRGQHLHSAHTAAGQVIGHRRSGCVLKRNGADDIGVIVSLDPSD